MAIISISPAGIDPTFFNAVTAQLAALPSGCVIAHGQLAALAGYPGYARQVAKLLKQLPPDTQLPWHRVIRADGRIAFPIESPMFLEQQQRLQAEDILFTQRRVAKRFWFDANAL